MMCCKASLFCCLAVMPLAAQQTWLVRKCPGTGAVNFNDLPAAVAAAAPGDTIRLLSEGSCRGHARTLRGSCRLSLISH